MEATGWGGRRPGAGRRPAREASKARKMRSMRAFDEEWNLIKEFSHIVKEDIERAAKLLKDV